MVNALKRLGVLVVVGAVLGDIVAMLVAPSAVTWFQTPGMGTALCNCVDLARQTARSLVRAQLVGAGIGALTLAVLGEIVHRVRQARRRRRAEAGPPPAPAPPPVADSPKDAG